VTRATRIGVTVAIALLAAAAPTAAFAHGGTGVTGLTVGGYRAKVDALLVRLSPSRDVVDFTTYLRDRHTGRPVVGASVSVTARTPSGTVGPLHALARANTYEVLVPVRNPGEWRRIRLHVAIGGPAGRASFDYAPPSLASAWLFEPGVLTGAGLALLLFGQAFLRLRRRGRHDHAPWSRALLFTAGVALATLALVSPLDAVGDSYLLSAHMLEHVLIGDAAPALILVALRGPLLFFFLPAAIIGALARLEPLRTLLSFLLRPRVSLAVWAMVIAAWHVPAAYDYTLTHQTVHDLEHGCFLLAGLLVWSQLVDPARRRALTVGGRLACAVALFWMGSVLSDVLIFSFRPLYPAYAAQAERLFGLSPFRDQQLAGLVMTGEQLLSLGTCAVLLLLPALRARRRQRAVGLVREEPA
jgi:cytochrome c oxidase assembly factor CtaG